MRTPIGSWSTAGVLGTTPMTPTNTFAHLSTIDMLKGETKWASDRRFDHVEYLLAEGLLRALIVAFSAVSVRR
jgi:hypothetical protein